MRALIAAAALAIVTGSATARPSVSDASALSALPIAMSVAAPAMFLVAGATFTVAAVEASADGTVWVLERASDGARASLRLAGGLSLAAGSAIEVIAFGAGWVLASGGRAVAYLPNEVGAALLHHEQLTR